MPKEKIIKGIKATLFKQGLEIAGKQLKKHWFWLRREDNFEEAWKIVEAFIKRSFYSKKVPPSIIPKRVETITDLKDETWW